MGLSNTTDSLTGLSIRRGAPVVAIVIGRVKGGYPDAFEAGARPGIYPNHLFRALSLPFRARAGDYSDIVPEKGQLPVQILCDMTKTSGWEEFSKLAFDWDKGIAVERPLRGFERPDPPKEILGTFVVAEATWMALMDGYPKRDDRSGDVALVKAAILDAVDRQQAKYDFGDADQILRLSCHRYCFAGDQVPTDMPRLAQALTELDGYWSIDRDLRSHLVYDSGRLSRDLVDLGRERVDLDTLESLLGSLWDYQACMYALDVNNRYLMPSSSGGQYLNHAETARLSSAAISSAIESGIDHAIDMDGEEDLDDLSSLVDEIEALGVRMRERIEAARSHFANLEMD